jgi:hypothetical protein
MKQGLIDTRDALSLVFEGPSYRWFAIAVFAAAAVLYAFTLPAANTGGVIGLISLQYLNPELLFFSLTLAAALSLALTLNVYAFRVAATRRGEGVTLGAILSTLVAPSICCSPLVPTLLALFGASTPQIFGLTGRIQGFVSDYELHILTVALVLMIYAVHLAGRSVAGACPLPAGRRTIHDPQT